MTAYVRTHSLKFPTSSMLFHRQEIKKNAVNAREWLLQNAYLLEEREQELCHKVYIEVKSGVGGVEASLFTGEIFKYILRIARHFGLDASVVEEQRVSGSAESSRGLLGASLFVSGVGVLPRFECEAGVHRVQRKPVTDRSRMHTSTCAITVSPSSDEVAAEVKSKDLQFQFMRSSGGGGQRRDKTDTAAFVRHKPTGVTAFCEKSRFQEENKEMAIEILAAKLENARRTAAEAEKKSFKMSHFGLLGRNEKIRTYNFDADRIVDHRSKTTVHGVESYFELGRPYQQLYQSTQDWIEEEKLQLILQQLNQQIDESL
ncbi:peptide chain release factor 1-like isoform X2 [Convolutriloba macropyga]|uniref:peptide chain release factor 1-like isoform X2 n=1 Tax=Convolutriloba macropyga TaxID=536237 RepID=UPI003F526AF6